MSSRRDRFVDLSLRILTGLIMAALVFALGLLAWRFLAEPEPATPAVPLVEVAPKPEATAEPAKPAPPAKDEVLLKPGQVYRCVVNGRTTFSDRPCPEGATTKAPGAAR